ncbi:5471_t:CDS:2 [Funneliformis caledonium]|uniref:ditrans,polycis-polyprenyl diphosphate synthase [(2E,6E)-farnesyldiphosphate specific] n=1 Tax=Funneliformis caledonium TaxID=1117310 RepID=A0A9N8VVU2_9GLOM|nr:5471_t:CDS:2 [Funneliformis caledonium]
MLLVIPLLLIIPVIIFYRRTNLFYSFLLILQFLYSFYKLCLSIPLILLRRRVPTSATKLIGDIKSLDKVPKHLAIMFWSDDIQDERLIEVALLCCWSQCFGVKIVSIYDAEGRLGHYAHLLQSQINIISQKFFISEKIIPTIQAEPGMSCNGDYFIIFKVLLTLTILILVELLVNLVSRSDGRTRIVNVAKSLTDDIKQEKIKYEDVNILELDKRLSSMY